MKRGIKWAVALVVVVLIAAGVMRTLIAAMIFGMVPLAFALTEGPEQRAPMGQAVIGGVITSSLLLLTITLVVMPVAYCYMDDLAQWFKRKFSGKTSAAGDDLRQEGEAHAV